MITSKLAVPRPRAFARLLSTSREAFSNIVYKRRTAYAFSAQEVQDDHLRFLLEMTQRAPSSFNAQPYRVLFVQGSPERQALSECMTGPANVHRVKNAPVTAIFLADLEVTKETEKVRFFCQQCWCFIDQLKLATSLLPAFGAQSAARQAAAGAQQAGGDGGVLQRRRRSGDQVEAGGRASAFTHEADAFRVPRGHLGFQEHDAGGGSLLVGRYCLGPRNSADGGLRRAAHSACPEDSRALRHSRGRGDRAP
mmetsp:Transcript_18887/g.71504  ORF Transcript_18887/g.71504 Transcript_18887/m.71504 type:complete len:252 (+) Transcript_18887:22-777(+)